VPLLTLDQQILLDLFCTFLLNNKNCKQSGFAGACGCELSTWVGHRAPHNG
jgi:hypothetical protein